VLHEIDATALAPTDRRASPLMRIITVLASTVARSLTTGTISMSGASLRKQAGRRQAGDGAAFRATITSGLASGRDGRNRCEYRRPAEILGERDGHCVFDLKVDESAGIEQRLLDQVSVAGSAFG